MAAVDVASCLTVRDEPAWSIVAVRDRGLNDLCVERAVLDHHASSPTRAVVGVVNLALGCNLLDHVIEVIVYTGDDTGHGGGTTVWKSDWIRTGSINDKDKPSGRIPVVLDCTGECGRVINRCAHADRFEPAECVIAHCPHLAIPVGALRHATTDLVKECGFFGTWVLDAYYFVDHVVRVARRVAFGVSVTEHVASCVIGEACDTSDGIG